MIDKTDAAYLLGRADYDDGRDVTENPYDEIDQRNGLWCQGWLDAEVDACERQGLRAAEDVR